MRLTSLIIALLAAGPGGAEPPCGTVVIPPGLGIESPTAVTGLNPLIGSSLYNAQIEYTIFRPLVWMNNAHVMDPALSVADHIDVSPDGSRYHIVLKHWLWSDGVPITADDVLYCYELVLKLGETWPGKGIGDMPDIIKTFTVTDPYTIDIELTRPYNADAFILNGLGDVFALPRHAWKGATTDELWRHQTDTAFLSVVSGPYRVAEYNLARNLILEANPLYSGRDRPSVRRIVVNFLEGTDELRAIETGDVDAANVPFPTWDAAQKLQGYNRVPVPLSFSYNSMTPNLRNDAVAFFRDVRVRQAMADAMDQQTMIDLVYHGSGVPERSPMPVEPERLLSPDARAGKFPVGYDPARARALLDEAGWVPGPDGVRVKDGRRLSFTNMLPSGRPIYVEVNQIFQRDLAAVGIEMKLLEIEFNQMLPIIYGHPKEWEASSLGWSMGGYPEGQTTYGTGGINNSGGYSDPKMDALTARANTEPGLAALFEYQDYAAEQQPWIYTPLGRQMMLVRPGIEGLDRAMLTTGYWAPEYIRLVGERACHAGDRKPA